MVVCEVLGHLFLLGNVLPRDPKYTGLSTSLPPDAQKLGRRCAGRHDDQQVRWTP